MCDDDHVSGGNDALRCARRRVASLAAHVAPPATALQRTAVASSARGAVVLVGGAVMDIQAWPAPGQALSAGTTTPGEVHQVPGGVARNIAAVLAALQPPGSPPPLLLSVVGDDAPGDALLSHTRCVRSTTTRLPTSALRRARADACRAVVTRPQLTRPAHARHARLPRRTHAVRLRRLRRRRRRGHSGRGGGLRPR